MKKSNKVIAIIITIYLFTTLLFSYLFIVENAHHVCTGEDCPICMEIEVAIHTIYSFKALPILPLILAVLCVFTHICMVIIEYDCTKYTLITLKVELLD